MKVIDEKGKIFGKLNIIDLLAILVILAALIFGAVKLLGSSKPPVEDDVDPAHLVYTVQVNSVSPDVYAEVLRQIENAGGTDQLMANGEMVDAYITHVDAAPHISYVTNADGETVISEETGENARYDLTFTVEANVPDPVTNLVGTQEVRVGKSHILKTVHFEFSYGTVLTCQWG